MWREKSKTTAWLQHWPASEVPPPRPSSGAPWARHSATARSTSRFERGITTPIGAWW